MRARAMLATALLGFGLLAAPVSAEQARTALLLSVEGGIGPGIAGYVEAGLARAAERGDALVVLRLDTPGGLDAATRRIVQAMLASPVPVTAWVGPRGARAASAGLLILSAAQVAAMAPGTATGAATPVLLGGGREDGAMREKRVNDAAAYARGLAEYHGRNPDWLEKAVRDAASVPAAEALRLGVIDLVAADPPALLAAIDGRRVRMPEGPRVLETSGLALRRFDPGWRDRLLTAISDPNIAYLLLMIGLGGLILEVATPGFGLGGVVGGIALILGLFALNLLPVDLTGLALMGLGAAMLVAEAFIPAFGLLGFGGLAALVLGAAIAFDIGVPGFALSPLVVATSAALLALLLGATMWSVWRSRRRPVRTGGQGMVGAPGQVLEWSAQGGSVLVHGERWAAVSPALLLPGQTVRVVARHGLRLTVAPEAAAQEGEAP